MVSETIFGFDYFTVFVGIGVSVACVITVLILHSLRLKTKRTTDNNGPVGYPFIGILSQLGNFNVIHHTLTAIGKQYGRMFHFEVLGKKMVVLRTVSITEQALTDDRLMDRKETFFQRYIFDGKGFAFANYANYVPEQRELFHVALYWRWNNRHKNETNFLRRLEPLLSEMIKNKSSDIDVDIYIKKLMTDAFSVELIGETLPEDHPDRNALWDIINLLYQLMDPSIDTPLRNLPFLRFLPIKHGRLFKDAIKARDRISSLYFDSQKESYKDGEIRGLVDVCLKMQANEPWLTDDKIKGLMYDTVIAGMSEMMKSIRMLVLLMCHYQDTQSRVRAEIDDVIGSRDDITAEDKENMPYTVAVIMEMLRYVSQTPLAIPHKCNNDVTLDGYVIEKNSGIFPNIWSIHHDDDVWGDPWCFRPDRFLADDGTLLPPDHKHRRTLIPFSVGRRRCPGEDFAMSGLFIVFTKMLQKVQFLPPTNEDLPSADPRLYNNKFPLYLPVFKCRVEPRDES